ncbi:hypothetical protein CSC79_16665 [Pseudoalteromonas sp. 3D05]|nr:hypothetical protein CSC79_16665 [Pseudoalteromonas sp. 3D05]
MRVGLKAIYTALLILTIEPLLFAINALHKSLLIPTDIRILRWLGYNSKGSYFVNLERCLKHVILSLSIY